MNLFRTLRYPVSLVATAGLFSLLMADSAEEQCAQSSFDRTFDIATTCGGTLSGRIRINGSFQVGISADTTNLPVTRVSGDVAPGSGGPIGSCSDEGEPFTTTGVTIGLPTAAPGETGAGGGSGAGGSGGAGATTSSSSAGSGATSYVATCKVDLKTQLGKDVVCNISDGTTNPDGTPLNVGTCTTRLTAVQ